MPAAEADPDDISTHREERTMIATIYEVDGMTRGHCVNAVTGELTKLGGVSWVTVDLDTGKVTVTSERPLDPDAVHAAITDAGYELTGTAYVPL
jgi:copper chaperone CopZ